MRALPPRPAPLSLAAQAHGLRARFPNAKITATRQGVSWRGELSPAQYARSYDVEMRYRRSAQPEVWVRAPDLHALSGDRRLPHVYDQAEQRLCLFVPGCGIWRPNRALASTILPWACYWLRLFELWIFTDSWHERGVHPEPRQPTRSASKAVAIRL